MDTCVINSINNYYPDPNENVVQSIFKQYENVIVQSIITSFGLDFLVKDNHGGDVDTILNVRKIGKDENMTYKNSNNAKAYANRGEYDSHLYHSDSGYIEKNRAVSNQKKEGTLVDAYTGNKIPVNGKTDLDHVISAKEIHEDRGRVLSGLSGVDLANSDENLQATNPHTNRTKKADSMEEFLNKKGDEYTEAEKNRMLEIDKAARKSYEQKLNKAYYTSPAFATDVAKAAGKVGAKMGLRQLLGFVFAEIWFAIKDEFRKYDLHFNLELDLGLFFESIGDGVKTGLNNAKNKYKELFEKFASGTMAGTLASLTTTLCNIFFTTAKNVVKIIRQSYASIVEAGKILLINPDNYPFGERLRAASKVIATGASVVLGGIVSESISKTPIASIPIIGDIVTTFCGTLCTGIVSCTLLYYLDRSKIINSIVEKLNNINPIDKEVEYYRKKAELFEKYAAELMQIDLDILRNEISVYSDAVDSISNIYDQKELNAVLKNKLLSLGITMSWEDSHGNFKDFMKDKNSRLVFE